MVEGGAGGVQEGNATAHPRRAETRIKHCYNVLFTAGFTMHRCVVAIDAVLTRSFFAGGVAYRGFQKKPVTVRKVP